MADHALQTTLSAHLTGDLHQPLHVADDGDRGGNQVEFEFGDRRSRYGQNLHGIWVRELAETAIVSMRVPSSVKSQAIVAASARVSIDDCARDTWAVARASAYGSLLGNRCTLPAMPIAISGNYVRQSVPVIQLQIRRAGGSGSIECLDSIGC